MSIYEFIILCSAIVLVGLPLTILTVFIVKRVREMSVTNKIKGAIYITPEGEAFMELYDDPKILQSESYILLEVGKIRPDDYAFKVKPQ